MSKKKKKLNNYIVLKVDNDSGEVCDFYDTWSYEQAQHANRYFYNGNGFILPKEFVEGKYIINGLINNFKNFYN